MLACKCIDNAFPIHCKLQQGRKLDENTLIAARRVKYSQPASSQCHIQDQADVAHLGTGQVLKYRDEIK